jgi:FtsP/CotA-like multicopper oxidase with cupredoxin domain
MGPRPPIDRRRFLEAGGATALLCAVGGAKLQNVSLRDVQAADRAAADLTAARSSARKPAGTPRDAVDRLTFETPKPAPGGRAREYWLQARAVTWNFAPTGRDEWMDHPIPGRRTFTGYAYQLFAPGFAKPLLPPSIPGPTLEAETGDTIVVHFRNGDRRFNQAVTVHPHGVRYTPDYDGAYYGDLTRAGGFVAPGEEFTYTWDCPPGSAGVWPYHDHGPNHTLNTFRGLFGAVVVRPRGEPAPDVEHVLFLHSFPPQVTGGIPRLIQCVNGRTAAGNTPTIRAKVGQDVAIHVIGGDGNFHTFHIHGHRWKDPRGGGHTDCPTVGPNETITARFTEDNPGRWLYHCHVFNHQDAGMAGWYLVDP